jgi:hypothetical protein
MNPSRSKNVFSTIVAASLVVGTALVFAALKHATDRMLITM